MSHPLPIGKVAGFRGTAGALTVRVASGHAERWVGLEKVWIERGGGGADGEPRLIEVESARAYRDRLVLKLRGVDSPTEAERLRGAVVAAPDDEVPALPEGVYYVERLIGLEVVDEDGRRLGRVREVLSKGGADLLEVEAEGEEEFLVPMARSIVLEVEPVEGYVKVRLPEGLREGGVD